MNEGIEFLMRNGNTMTVKQLSDRLKAVNGGVGNPYNLAYQPQILVASYGDSITKISPYANFDIRNVVGTIVGYAPERMGFWLPVLSGGIIRFVANCGVPGDDTVNMIAREVASPTATRKSIADAAAMGATHIINSFGINDMQNYQVEYSSLATITAVSNTAVANAIILLKKQRAANLYPITPSLYGYNISIWSAEKIRVVQAGAKIFNANLSLAIIAAKGALGSWVDVYSTVADPVTGAWKIGYDDGLGVHPGIEGAKIISNLIKDELFQVSGIQGPPQSIYPNYPNQFLNADFSASTSGLATGVGMWTPAGTVTKVASIVDWRGKNWQEVLCTATALGGSGYATVEIDITIPVTNFVTGSIIAGEMDLYMDDGNGQAPNIYQWTVKLRQNAVELDMPSYNPGINPAQPPLTAMDYHMSFNPLTVPATPITSSVITIILAMNQLSKTTRIRIALPNVVKLS